MARLVGGGEEPHRPSSPDMERPVDLAVDPDRPRRFGMGQGRSDGRQVALQLIACRNALKTVGIFLGDKAGCDLARTETRVLHHRRQKVDVVAQPLRSEEHTSELQSLMRISYAVFCLKKNKAY